MSTEPNVAPPAPPAVPAPAATPPAAPSLPNPTGQPPAAPSTNFRDFIGDDGKFKPGWTKAFGAPETLETKFTEPKALVGSYASLEKMISAKGVINPGKDATPEQKAAYYDALGRPAKPEEYGIKMPEKVGDKPYPKEFWNPALADGAAKVFHAAGLTKEQAEAVTNLHNEITMKAAGDAQAFQAKMLADGTAALKAEWGAQYAENLALAEKGAAAAGLTAATLAAKPYLSNDPDYIKSMAAFGKAIAEQPAAGARGSQSNAQNPASEIAAIMGDLKHAYHANFKANGHSQQQHDTAVQHMKALYEMKTPG